MSAMKAHLDALISAGLTPGEPVEWDDRYSWVPVEDFPEWWGKPGEAMCEVWDGTEHPATRILDAREAGWFTFCDMHPVLTEGVAGFTPGTRKPWSEDSPAFAPGENVAWNHHEETDDSHHVLAGVVVSTRLVDGARRYWLSCDRVSCGCDQGGRGAGHHIVGGSAFTQAEYANAGLLPLF